MPLALAGRWRAMARPGSAMLRAGGQLVQVGARDDVVELAPDAGDRVLAHGEADVRVVGDQQLPRVGLGQHRHAADVPGRARAGAPPRTDAERMARPSSHSSRRRGPSPSQAPERDEPLQPVLREVEPAGEVAHGAEGAAVLALAHHRRGALLAEPRDRGEPHPHRAVLQPGTRRASGAGRDGAPRCRAARRRAPARPAGRSPSAARSAASRGTPRGGAAAATRSGRRAARTRRRAPWGSRTPRRRGPSRTPVRAVCSGTPRLAAPSRNACHCASIAARERRRLIARRSVSAWPGGEAGERLRPRRAPGPGTRSRRASRPAPPPAAGGRTGRGTTGRRAAACSRCR